MHDVLLNGLSEARSSLHTGETEVDRMPLPAGINAAQWNYQRDAAANNAWEDRRELLMDWSSSVVSITVNSFLCRSLVAHMLWPKAQSHTPWQMQHTMRRRIPAWQACLAMVNVFCAVQPVCRPAGILARTVLRLTAHCAVCSLATTCMPRVELPPAGVPVSMAGTEAGTCPQVHSP